MVTANGMAIAVAEQPLDVSSIGRPRGRLAVIGLGPGAAELMVPAVKAELARATDVLGYETYVRMAGPFRDDQVQHCTDNREEMQRARHAFRLAAAGPFGDRRVVRRSGCVRHGGGGARSVARIELIRPGTASIWKSCRAFPRRWPPPRRPARRWAMTSA